MLREQYSFQFVDFYASILETLRTVKEPQIEVRDDKKKNKKKEEDVRGANVSYPTINENQSSEDRYALR